MLGVLVTSYVIEDFPYHDEVLLPYADRSKVVFVTNNPDALGRPLGFRHQTISLASNDGKHDGTFNMISGASGLFKDCDYVLHYHADQRFRDGRVIDEVYQKTRGRYRIASIPRQWMFDAGFQYVDNGAVPFHTSFFMMQRELLEDVFAAGQLAQYKAAGGDSGMHFEAMVYYGLLKHRIDYNHDVLYVESIAEMKRRHGSSLVYHDTWFEDSGIIHLSTGADRRPLSEPGDARCRHADGTVNAQ